MIFLENFSVKQFRGIHELKVNGLGDINLIVGDNNSGKTSVLESIMLLRNTSTFANILNVVRLRDNGFFSPFRLSTFENFLYMFNPESEDKSIEVEGVIGNTNVGVKVSGTVENVLIDIAEIRDRHRNTRDMQESGVIYDEAEVAEFQGVITSKNGNDILNEEIRFNEYTRLTGMRASKPETIEIVYVSPTDHTSGNVFSKIVKNDDYKNIVLHVIKIFDVDIEDILYIKNEQTSRPIECLKHKKLGIMPLATYGDGIKKVLLLANSIASAAGGILLVDEIETAIHARHYDDIFKFVIKACHQFKIQLFATTHSIEAVDGFLATQCDEEKENYINGDNDVIRIVTFRKNSEKNKTDARVLSGKEVFENRKNFEFEVRL